ncbi:hypothetical protein [Microvirga ossetica]|nr:hypothetical protein [Microvirga ossetica]
MKPKEARRILDALLSKFGPAPDGGATLVHGSVMPPEIGVLQCVLRYYNARAVFTADHVTRDFLMAAQKNKLIEGRGDQFKEKLKPLLAMFTLQAMHRTTILLERQWRATLNAGTHQGELAVFASTVFEAQRPGPRHGIQAPIFTTGIPAREWCDAALDVGEYVVWDKPIEIGPKGKLTALILPET